MLRSDHRQPLLFAPLARDPEAALDEVAGYAERFGAVPYFDPSDSTGWLQPQVLPFVTRYYKAQLKDSAGYFAPHYGNRIYTDQYHLEFSVADDNPVKGCVGGAARVAQ